MTTQKITRPEGEINQANGGVLPWDIERPQPAFVELAKAGELRGSVLDVGCRTGENALYLAGLGHEVWGVDSALAAIQKARSKSVQRGVRVNFRLVDALELRCLGKTFDTVIDSGLFQVFSDEDRIRFRESLAAVLLPGGTYFLLCFNEQETGEGPRRITQAEIRSSFQDGWTVNYIREARFETDIHPGGACAWLASITGVCLDLERNDIDNPQNFEHVDNAAIRNNL
jgi:SAM-dependent methyltransferase